MARCATGSWDAVVLTHSSFERIGVSDATRRSFLERRLEDMRAAIAASKGLTVKRLEARVAALEERHKRLMAEPRKDAGLCFEAMGIDYLFVDEAQAYKNRHFVTSIPGVGGEGSQRAEDLELKLEYLRSRHGERVATFATARSTVAMALEQAIAAGDFVPGARGWREHQHAVAAGALDRPHPTLPTQTWRSAILTERLEHWVSFARGRSQELGALRSRHANRLLPPIPVPDDDADRLAPLRWLLGEIETRGGLDLTQTGALNRAFVIEATQRWGWREHGLRGPNRQDDVWQLGAVHDLARRCGAARRHRRRLQLTPSGRAMAADPTLAWARVVPWLAGDDDFDQMMAEIATLVLLDHDSREIATDELWPRVAALAAEHGWRVEGHGGEPPGEREVRWAARPWLSIGGLFALVVEEGDWPSRRIRLTPAGESAMLAYLRSRAAGPRSGLFA